MNIFSHGDNVNNLVGWICSWSNFYGFVISHTTTYIQFTCDKIGTRRTNEKGIFFSVKEFTIPSICIKYSQSKCDKQHINWSKIVK